MALHIFSWCFCVFVNGIGIGNEGEAIRQWHNRTMRSGYWLGLGVTIPWI